MFGGKIHVRTGAALVYGLRGFFLYLLSGVSFVFSFSPPLYSSTDQALNVRGNYGLFRMMVVPAIEMGDYQLVQSVEYVTQGDLFGDPSSANPEVDSLKGTFACALSPLRFVNVGGFFEFSNTDYTLSRVPGLRGQTTSSPVFKTGFHVTGFLDAEWTKRERLLALGLDLMFELSQVERVFSNPIVDPTLIVSNDWRSVGIPIRSHLNLGFRWKNRERYFGQKAPDSLDRFAVHARDNYALVAAVGIEVPIHSDVIPHLEYSYEKIDGAVFAANPNVLTIGVRATPFLLKNLVLFGGVDWGVVREFTAGYPATPLWNVVVGVNLQRFGERRNAREISENEYSALTDRVQAQRKQMQKITHDLNLSSFTGVVSDSNTGGTLEGVKIGFPNSDQLEELTTTKEGRFFRYYSDFGEQQVLFTKTGYDEAKRFVNLKPGEKIDLQVQLRPRTGQVEEGELEVIVVSAENRPLKALVVIKNVVSGEAEQVETPGDGRLLKRLKTGKYRLEIKSSGYASIQREVVVEAGQKNIQMLHLK